MVLLFVIRPYHALIAAPTVIGFMLFNLLCDMVQQWVNNWRYIQVISISPYLITELETIDIQFLCLHSFIQRDKEIIASRRFAVEMALLVCFVFY